MTPSTSIRPRGDDGFTMTEILVVILIICILAAIAVPTLLTQRQKGIDATAKSNVATAARALVIYDEDHDTYACGTQAQCVTALRKIEPEVLNSVDVSGSGGTGNATAHGYRVTTAGGQQRTFWQDRDPVPETTARGCDLNGSSDNGGCQVSDGATTGRW